MVLCFCDLLLRLFPDLEEVLLQGPESFEESLCKVLRFVLPLLSFDPCCLQLLLQGGNQLIPRVRQVPLVSQISLVG